MIGNEILKSITSDQLNQVVDADLSAHETQTEDAVHIVEWLSEKYPEMIKFAHESASRYFEDDAVVDPELVKLIVMNTAVTLGALCRAVEARELLGE